MNTHPLVGMCLHIFDEEGGRRVVSRQGEIVAAIGDDLVLVGWREWFAGTRSTTTLVRLSDLIEPKAQFYANVAEMAQWYERRYGAREPNAGNLEDYPPRAPTAARGEKSETRK